jgi:hypothetical protein
VSNALGDLWPKRAVGRKSQPPQDATNNVVYIVLDLSRAVDSPPYRDPLQTHRLVWPHSRSVPPARHGSNPARTTACEMDHPRRRDFRPSAL